MKPAVPRMLVALFLVSGATSLVWQTVWARHLHLLLGTSSTAIAAVLAAFMAGLSLGGALGGRLAAKTPRPLAVYGVLEIAIGAYALVFPAIVRGVTPIVLAVDGVLAPAVHLSLAIALLIGPTTAMGATLPLLSRLVADRTGTVGDRVATLYAVNTAGAVVGTAVAGLGLLPLLGLWMTTVLTAAGNVGVGVAAWFGERAFPPAVIENDLAEVDADTTGVSMVLLAGLAGLGALVLEVAWTRLVALLLGGSTYAFTAMLLAVLLGIALGSRAGGILADDALRSGGYAAVLRGFALLQLSLGAVAVGLTFLWPQVPYAFVLLFDLFAGRRDPMAAFVAALLCAIALLLVPATLMGAAFPFAVRAATGATVEVSDGVGRVYAANTFGGVVGAASAGLLLPVTGLRGLVALAATVHAIAAVIAAWRGGSRRLAAVSAAVAVAALLIRAPWDPLWMSGGMYQYVSHFDDHSRAALHRFATKDQELLYYAEGASTVVTVAQNRTSGNLWLANNGKIDASTTGDLPTQVLVALIGAMHAKRTDSVVVIGLASGITAGAVTTLPGLGHLDIVELEPKVIEAARFFDAYNRKVLDNPRVTAIADDGRHYLLRAEPGSFDLIVSEPSNPYLSGVANLFTEEFWQIGRARLAPDGVFAQWIQLYGMGPDELRGLLRTFGMVFPNVALYIAIGGADIVVVGSDAPLSPRPELAEALLASPDVAEALQSIGIHDATALVAHHAMDRDQVMAFAGDTRLVTDDNLRVEFAAPLWLHTDVSLTNWRDLLDNAHLPEGVLPQDALAWVDLADTYGRIGDPRRAKLARQRALALLDPADPLYEEVSRGLP